MIFVAEFWILTSLDNGVVIATDACSRAPKRFLYALTCGEAKGR